jgi:hypothetical protein
VVLRWCSVVDVLFRRGSVQARAGRYVCVPRSPDDASRGCRQAVDRHPLWTALSIFAADADLRDPRPPRSSPATNTSTPTVSLRQTEGSAPATASRCRPSLPLAPGMPSTTPSVHRERPLTAPQWTSRSRGARQPNRADHDAPRPGLPEPLDPLAHLAELSASDHGRVGLGAAPTAAARACFESRSRC